MVAWKNLDTLESYKALQDTKGNVNLTEAMAGQNGADRVKKYAIPMAEGLTYHYAAKKVDDDILEKLASLAKEAQLSEKFQELYNGAVINLTENRRVLHQLTRGQLGGKVMTMSDSDGYIYDPDGIDRAKLDYIMELKNVYRGRIREYVEQYPSAKYVGDGAKPWFEKADIACPCATQNELNEEAAKALVANGVIAVAEGANMPSTPGAIKVFQDAKILYSPGKASNAGGVSVSGLEMSQNSERLSWSSEEVDAKLLWIMENIHENCVKYGTEPDGYVNYVKGANVAGFMKVAKAMMAQGLV